MNKSYLITALVVIFLSPFQIITSQTWEAEPLQAGYILRISPVADNPDLVFAMPESYETGLAKIQFTNNIPDVSLERKDLNYVVPNPDSGWLLYNSVGMVVNNKGEVIVALNHGQQTRLMKRDLWGNWSVILEENITQPYITGQDNFILMEYYDPSFGDRRRVSYNFGESWTEVNWQNVFGITENVLFHPEDENVLYIASFSGLHKSIDKGITISETIVEKPVLDIAIIEKSDNTYRLFASLGLTTIRDSLIYSDNFGTSWERITNHPVFIKMDKTPVQDEIIGVTEDSFGLSTDAGITWSFTPIIHPNPSVGEFCLLVKSTKTVPKRFFVGTAVNGLYFSDDNGRTWSSIMIPRSNTTDIASLNNDYMFVAGQFSASLFRKTVTGWDLIFNNYLVQPKKVAIKPDEPNVILCGFYDWTQGLFPYLNLSRSTDSGNTWENVFLQATVNGPAEIKFDPNNPQVVFLAAGLPAATGDPSLWKSTDGGLTWNPAYNSDNFSATSIFIDENNSNHIVVSGDPAADTELGQKLIIRSTNGGNNWEVLWEENFYRTLTYKLFSPEGHSNILFLGTDEGLYKSTDAGNSWYLSLQEYVIKDITEDPVNNYLLTFSDANNTLYKSTDLGETWIAESSFREQTNINIITKLHVANDNGTPRLYVGTFGAGLFSSPPIITSVDDKNEDSYPQDFVLHQNYPNPFNPATTIKFSIPEISKVSIKVYNVLGKHISTLADGLFSAGTHIISFNGTDKKLSSGVYFYTMDTYSQNGKVTSSITKRMMLIK